MDERVMMRRAPIESVVQHPDAPAMIRAASGLVDPDYIDFFTLATHLTKSPEQWARAVIGAVPPAASFLIWRTLLGLRLEPASSPDQIAGWKIAERGDHWIRVEAASWFMTAKIVFQVVESQVSFATFVRYDGAAARLIWPPVSVMHRQAVPDLLRRAARTLDEGVA